MSDDGTADLSGRTRRAPRRADASRAKSNDPAPYQGPTWPPAPEAFVARSFRLRQSEDARLMELQRVLGCRNSIDAIRYLLNEVTPREIDRLRAQDEP